MFDLTPFTQTLSALAQRPKHTCLLCHDTTQGTLNLCEACRQDLPRIHNACARCGLPLPTNAPQCGACQRLKLAYRRCFSLFEYRHPVDFAIKAFKHHNSVQAQRLLCQLMVEASRSLPWQEWQGLVPVPLHWQKLLKRGFNQAHVLAQSLHRQNGVSVISVKRQHTNPAQQSLNRQQRLNNLRGVFAVNDSKTQRLLTGKNLLIVDDVVTTGATVNALAEVLKQAGAQQVDVLCLARTPSP